jgi:hypothetical protein
LICNKAFDGMTDGNGSEMVMLFNFQISKLTLLSLTTAHTDEHGFIAKFDRGESEALFRY